MKKVLVVEDDTFLAKIYESKLKHEGYDAKVANDGVEGMEALAEMKPNIVLLDLVMPRKDGFTVLKEMSEDSELKKIPVVVLSNLGQDSDVDRVKELGAKDYLVKADISISDVVDTINKYAN